MLTMKTINLTRLLPFFSIIIFIAAGCSKSSESVVTTPPPPPANPVIKPNQLFFGLTANNQLARFNANASAVAISSVAITGMQSGEKMLGIDFRPATGQLYGVGSLDRLYVINTTTGVARAVGAPFTPGIAGTVVGFDFNPTVDRIRLVTDATINLRLNPETGAVAAVDGNINPATRITGAAYTNSFAGTATTTLYDTDGFTLFKQDPPNNGTLVAVGNLGVYGLGGADFDISPDNKTALAPLTVGGVCSLYQLDLNTGAATNLGQLAASVISIAIPTNPVAYSTDDANNLLIFDLVRPGTLVTKAITGLQPGENVLGIDMRPATGQLFALGSTSRIYAINMSSGAATAIGAGPFTPALTGTSFGFDFNPTVDRIRVVSNTGQNLRLDPNTGLAAANDGTLNPGTPAISAAGYTNSFAGTTTTSLFVIDATTDKLYLQNPPNAGTLVEIGSLGVNITAANGFDIGGTSNLAYALLTVGTTTRIYQINLTTGAAIAVDSFTGLAGGFAVGLGF